MIQRNFWFFALAGLFCFSLIATITVFKGDYGIAEKIVCPIALVIAFFWLLPHFLNFLTDIMVPQTLRGRRLFIEQSDGGYDMMGIVSFLSKYFAEQGALIANDPSLAEFKITLRPNIIEPTAMFCRLSDQHGFTETTTEYSQFWPRSFALALTKFIRASDQRPVKN